MNKLLLSLVFMIMKTVPASVITYNPEALGRIGDRLMLYTKALWLADLKNIPLYHKSFSFLDAHSQNLQSDQYINLKDSNQITTLPELPQITVTSSNSFNTTNDHIYNISYYYKHHNWEDALEVCTWKDLIDNQNFLEKLRTFIAPLHPIKELNIPTDRVCVAVHTRKGSGTELPLLIKTTEDHPKTRAFADQLWPKKFIPDSFFIEQIKSLSEKLGHPPLYIYIFTDYHSPGDIAEKYKYALKDLNIQFGYRDIGNDHCTHTLEDLFNMTQFEYLIRGGSNYAQIAHLIGQFRIVIYPKEAYWQGKKMIVKPGIFYRKS